MTNELVNGFTIHRNGHTVAVSADFSTAQDTAAEHIAGSDKSVAFQIRTASSAVIRGVGASPVRIWNYDWSLKSWVEHV